jgi:hypothetical protein
LIAAGLTTGEPVIISQMKTVTDGMKVRTINEPVETRP